MTTRGHHRTAVECRSKTKVMRLEYKRVIGHNSRAGSNKVTCPFYKQLHRILRGDASVRPKRVSRSLNFKQGPQQEAVPDPPVMEEQFSPGDLNIINIGDYLKEESMDNVADGTVAVHGNEEELLNVGNFTQTEEEESNGGSGRDLDLKRPQLSPGAHVPPDTFEPPAVPSKEPEPPTTRLSLIRNKKKRERAESMFQLFMEQAREDSQKEQEEMARDRVVLARFLTAFERDAADSREERRQCLEAMRANCDMLQGIVNGLNKLMDAIAGQQQASTRSQARPPLHSATHKDLPLNSTPGARSGSLQEVPPSYPTSNASAAPKSGSRKPSHGTHPLPRVMCNLG
uniref:Uncharacterized protein isoform X1 n=1 Tax=Pogona vitticeps TaxID=103695 RepID=A0A6J0SIN5_9SAUR